MKRLIDRIGSLGHWLIPILSGTVATVLVPVLLGLWAVHPVYELHKHPGYLRLAQACLSVVMVTATAVLIITLLLNSWGWVMRCPKRRYAAQAILGVGASGVLGYAYSDLFWRSLEGDILLLAHVRGIRIWLVVQLVAFNFLFVFLPYSMRFARTGASPQRGYLEYLLARDAAGGERELSLQKEVAYIQAEGGRRCVFTAGPGSGALHIGHALSDLEQQVDPELYFLLNRNFLVHRDAIRDWKDEPGGRRVMVWLNPAVAGCPRSGGAPRETCVWVSKEKAGPFREWYAMGRTG